MTDLKPAQTRELGLRRVVATVVGAVTGAVLSPFLAPTARAIGASVLLAILLSYLLQAREGAKIPGYICALIVLDNSASPWLDGLYRMIETALSVGVFRVISYVPKPIPVNEPIEERNERSQSRALSSVKPSSSPFTARRSNLEKDQSGRRRCSYE